MRGQRILGGYLYGPALISSSGSPFSLPPWRKIVDAAAFSGRDGAGLVSHRNALVLTGGWTPPTYRDVSRTYDGSGWSLRAGYDAVAPGAGSPWENRHSHGCVTDGTRIWILGGDTQLGHYQPDVWWSYAGGQWIQATAAAPWGLRALHMCGYHNGALFVAGGQTFPDSVAVPAAPTVFYDDVWRSTDGINWTRVVEHAGWAGRGGTNLVSFAGKLWVIGGGRYEQADAPNRVHYNDVWASTDDGVTWVQTTAAAAWLARFWHETVAFNGMLVLSGGANNGAPGFIGNLGDVWWSLDGANWAQQPTTAVPWTRRHAHSVAVHQGALWLLAGSAGAGAGTPMNDVWQMSPALVQPVEPAVIRTPTTDDQLLDQGWDAQLLTPITDGDAWTLGGAAGNEVGAVRGRVLVPTGAMTRAASCVMPKFTANGVQFTAAGDQHFVCNSNAQLDFGTGDWTICICYKGTVGWANPGGGEQDFMGKMNAAGARGWLLYSTAAATFLGIWDATGFTNHGLISGNLTTAINYDGNWHLLTIACRHNDPDAAGAQSLYTYFDALATYRGVNGRPGDLTVADRPFFLGSWPGFNDAPGLTIKYAGVWCGHAAQRSGHDALYRALIG